MRFNEYNPWDTKPVYIHVIFYTEVMFHSEFLENQQSKAILALDVSLKLPGRFVSKDSRLVPSLKPTA